MSIKVQSYVWDNSKATGSALLLLLAIADFAHDDGGGAWPSLETLAHKCRQSVRNVQYLLEKLTGLGELKIRPDAGPNGTNAYTIVLPANFAGSKPLDKPKAKTPAPDFTPDMQTGADSSCNPARQISPKPLGIIIEPPQPPGNEAAAVVDSQKESAEEDKVALTFRNYQRVISFSFSPTMAERIRDDIADVPARCIQYAFEQCEIANVKKWSYVLGILDKLRANNWVIPDKHNGNGNGPPGQMYAEAWLEMNAHEGESPQQVLDRLKVEGKVDARGIVNWRDDAKNTGRYTPVR